MTVIDGRHTAAAIRAELRLRAAAFEERTLRKVGLAVVCIGDDAASEIYIRNKVKACAEVGIGSVVCRLGADCTQEEAERLLGQLAADRTVDAILVQLPLPARLDGRAILSKIPPQKDADGFCAENLGHLLLREEGVCACTPLGVMELLARYRIPVRGKHAVVLGRSNIVGKPLAMLLLNADATVTVCHSQTQGLKEICRQADILISAVGHAGLVTADMVKEGAAVIDVGINRIDGKACGDVDFEQVAKKAAFLTPVPGGVGPMTVAMLLKNTLDAAERWA